jgi:hypothetical protein
MNATRKKPLVKVANALKPISGLPEDPPPLENVPVHVQLSRANARHAKLTEELRTLKADFAAENIRAQQTRTQISTSRITFVETKRRELHLDLERAQAEIGRLNKELRERKVQKQGNGSKPAAPPKTRPLAADLEFDVYFRLAAHSELAPALYSQVERVAKSLLNDARRMGVED